MNVTINDLPRNVNRYTWIVCRAVEGEVWYYSGWYAGQKADALAQAAEVDGFVVENLSVAP